MPDLARQERLLDAWITLGLVVLASLLYLPALGSYALWDPWEAHYSQVAMEMVRTGSWWEPVYRASTRSFWSKPIYTFWLMIGSLKTFRIAQVGSFAQAEFYLRLPIALTGAMGVGFMFFFVRRLWNRRVGVLAALILATCPQYFLISRQIMVDIPFVVLQLMALGFLALGLFDPKTTETGEERRRGFFNTLLAAAALAGIFVVEVVVWKFRMGVSFAQSFQQSNLLWLAASVLLAVWAGIRLSGMSPQRRAFLLFFVFSGFVFLAKGLLSVVLPGGVVLFYILATGDWNLLRRMGLVHNPTNGGSFGLSILFGTLSTLLAIILISMPMFRGGIARTLRLTSSKKGLQRNIGYSNRRYNNRIQRIQKRKYGNKKALSAALRRAKSIRDREIRAYKRSYNWGSVVAPVDRLIVKPYNKLPLQKKLWVFVLLLVILALIATVVGGEHRKDAFLSVVLPGTLIYILVAGSWVFVMNHKHGMPFMKEWFIYHHFSRMQGVIEKPNNTFDLYFKQIAFGMFPWSALIPVAFARFLRWNGSDTDKPARLRNLFFFLCFFFPFFFYTFSSTKFHHYIFPVVPFLAIIVAAWVSRLFEKFGVESERIGVGVSLLFFILLAKDLMTNYKPLHQLFTYYTNRATPATVYPRKAFLVMFGIMGLLWLSFFLVRRIRGFQFGAYFAAVAVFVLFVNVKLIPSVGVNFSFKSLYTAYMKYSKGKKIPFGEFGNWDERSTSYYFNQVCWNNKANKFRGRFDKKLCSARGSHRSLAKGRRNPDFSQYLGSVGKARAFLRDYKMSYILVAKRKITTLRNIAKGLGKQIYIVDRPHYDMWLVSTQKPTGMSRRNIVLKSKPNMNTRHWKRMNCDFGGKIRMIGVWQSKPGGYKRGERVEIRFLYKVEKKLRKNWKAFIHADPVKWTRHRLNWDHELAEGLYPPTDWKVGEYVQDIVVRTIPRNYPGHYRSLSLWTGLWLGSNRLPVKRCYGASHDGMNRIMPIRIKLK